MKKELETIIRDYTTGEKTLAEVNEALAAAGTGLKLDPEKNVIQPGEEHAYGLLDTGTGTLDKVRIKGGRLVNCDCGAMPARVCWQGKWYEVMGDALIMPGE